ncbi:tautomerase family protein [Halobaculum magnesiiphilum]|uniref:4-oxalocrotonate tautomerase family protein n=1 Tax=Halobaculum magnesiiphilum TaxID=1017351 RepID=A0A8T8WE88_9EURY|nr:tautomerase family protein [Halobaculum magnesiiphilum]QZP38096.1 4-oxalocrotonate tautomerase family protein [Halobaculum magnesiiphilum]
MPHLRFDLSVAVTDDERASFADWVAETYAEVMDTGTDHVGVAVVESDPQLGGAGEDDPVALVNADVRVGRTVDQRHALARRLTTELGDRFGIPERTVYVVLTEHEGADFVLGGEPLDAWDPAERDGASVAGDEGS